MIFSCFQNSLKNTLNFEKFNKILTFKILKAVKNSNFKKPLKIQNSKATQNHQQSNRKMSRMLSN